MWKRPPALPTDHHLASKLAALQRRPARYADAALEKRRHEFRQAIAMNRLEGASQLTPIEADLGELWATGRVSQKEYLVLCAECARAQAPEGER